MSKHRGFCGTWWNMEKFNDPIWEMESVLYSIRGKEIAPTTGNEHIQWAIYFKNPRTENGVKRIMPGAHVEVMRGTVAENQVYCSKDENYIEHGTVPKQGARKDLYAIGEAIINGATMLDVAVGNPDKFIQYGRGFKALRDLVMGKRTWKTEVIWLCGPTGTGKSQTAWNMAPNAYEKMGGNTWWDGYDGQEDVIIDDYRCDMCPFYYLLKLFDRYPMRVEIKGGTVQMLAKRIIVTAPFEPEVMWAFRANEDIKQLTRRVDRVLTFGENSGTEVLLGNTVPGVQVPMEVTPSPRGGSLVSPPPAGK